MVDKQYLLEKPPGPAPWKQYLNLTVLPALIDGAGAMEAVVETVAVQVRLRPFTQIAVALGLGYSIARMTGWRQPRRS